jgi:ribosomal RNA assembly protein
MNFEGFMKKVHFCDKELFRILANDNLKRLEKEFSVKIELKKGKKEGDFAIQGRNAVHEHIASEILEAIASGFDFYTAMLLKDENYVFKKVLLKNYASSSRLAVVKGRIVGTQGKSKRVIEKLTECDLCLCDNLVSLIGRAEHVEIASKAIQSLIRGSKHANVFQFLEKERKHLRELDEENIEASLR